ncbi:MAG: bifunctional nicotinamidase/pyrazinamidase [bacterium]
MEALIIVDIQKDFLPGGSLAVPSGDQVIPVINEFQKDFDMVIATQDWHPADHASFAVNHEGKQPGDKIKLDGLDQVLWPPHCIQGTEGSELANDLEKDKIQKIFRKGIDPKIDSYSAFFDNGHKRSTGLHEYFQENGVDTVYIAGLAADVCVRFSANDAIDLGYRVFIVKDATRVIDKKGGEEAEKQLSEKGVQYVESKQILVKLNK